MDISLWVLIAAIGVALMGPPPSNYAHRAWKREQRDRTRATAAAALAERQAWRLRVFGSHPFLYSVLAWLSLPAFLCLIAWLA